MKVYFYLLVIVIFCSCKNSNQEKIDFTDIEQKVINQEFKSKEVADLNDEATELGKNGFIEKANKKLLKALSIEQSNPITLSNLGLTNFHLGKHDKAINYLQESLKVSDSTYLIAGANLSFIYLKIGEYEKVIEISDFVIKESKDINVSIGAQIHKAYSLIHLNECKKAKIELNHIEKYMNEIDNLETHTDRLRTKINNCVQHSI